ncbi:hypothetical protein H4582DRAFT_1322973 [Lactarius indigo]|nr:hypothetical protein H4582DRAFT_1322973 [Lactarius indigo]
MYYMLHYVSSPSWSCLIVVWLKLLSCCHGSISSTYRRPQMARISKEHDGCGIARQYLRPYIYRIQAARRLQ